MILRRMQSLRMSWMHLRARIISVSKSRTYSPSSHPPILPHSTELTPFSSRNASEIPRYPRNIASTIRREDTHRKEVRDRRKERKEQEKAKKKEEVRRLKALKMKEIRKKLERIGKEGGVDEDEGTFVSMS